MNSTTVLADLEDDQDAISRNGSEEGYSSGDSDRARSQSAGAGGGGGSPVDIKQKILASLRRPVFAVGIILLLFLIAICATILIVASKSDEQSFKLTYDGFVRDISATVQWEAKYNMAIMDQLSASVTAAVVTTNTVLPHFTIPFYEIAGGYVDGLSGIMAVTYAPLIKARQVPQWEEYSVQNQGWISDSFRLRELHPIHRNPLKDTIQDHESDRRSLQGEQNITRNVFTWVDGVKVPLEFEAEDQWVAPFWQVSPPSGISVNADLLSDDYLRKLFETMIAMNQTVMSGDTKVYDIFDFMFDEDEKDRKNNGHNYIMTPVYDSFESDKTLVGVLVGLSALENLLDRLIDQDTKGILGVFRNECGDERTYEMNGIGHRSLQIAERDVHDHNFDAFRRSTSVESYESVVDSLCVHTLDIYPSRLFRESFDTSNAAFFKCIVVVVAFVCSYLVFLYDRHVNRRKKKAMEETALRTGALLESLFPENIRHRILQEEEIIPHAATTSESYEGSRPKPRPIADFYPNTTLMFADISGFTAWSSAREPFQVFELLETIYGTFDNIAKKRRVFKVETVGDCYVAAAGLPVRAKTAVEPAVRMARFARDCMRAMEKLSGELEVSLGPDTSSLAFRVGLHSGPVTAGVLRGENARFQLFGDTVNTASRMESTGQPSRIQLSSTTADLLKAANKGHWIVPRDELVAVKGKGEMNTYWLVMNENRTGEETTRSSMDDAFTDFMANVPSEAETLPLKTIRLVDWNTDTLCRILELANYPEISEGRTRLTSTDLDNAWIEVASKRGDIMAEVKEVIDFPKFEPLLGANDSFAVSEEVREQLRCYILAIAGKYPNNAFHNFEHASHVIMSVVKLMSRIVAAAKDSNTGSNITNNRKLYHGITDRLTQFACVFSALIHDVDHPGVPNAQLIREGASLASKYEGKSCAEQHSIDVAWSTLLEPKYRELRNTICPTAVEVVRFRQLVVNLVMATDVIDKDLKALRDDRWNCAFAEHDDPFTEDNMNRKATIVIEHVIQASDIAHTMQHWHIYRTWNERLFVEMSAAHALGRAQQNPKDFWFQGEISFLDFYVIPLAKKLGSCGVFGVSSDEYLAYAEKNLQEWKRRGKEVVEEMTKSPRAISLQDRVPPKLGTILSIKEWQSNRKLRIEQEVDELIGSDSFLSCSEPGSIHAESVNSDCDDLEKVEVQLV